MSLYASAFWKLTGRPNMEMGGRFYSFKIKSSLPVNVCISIITMLIGSLNLGDVCGLQPVNKLFIATLRGCLLIF